jgi:DNA excision repair protein ERCC-6
LQERDFLIRTGVVTPFDRLKGFERRVESSSSNDRLEEISIANAAASMAAIAKARPATKLLDASELPKLAPPTREFRRIKKVQHYTGPEETSVKSKKGRNEKRKRPMPDSKWRKKLRVESDGQVDSDDAAVDDDDGMEGRHEQRMYVCWI